MELSPLERRLRLPVRVVHVNGIPKIVAGGAPVVPFNVVLKRRLERDGATATSLDTYVRAAKRYAEFAAHLGRSIIEVTNEEFGLFIAALQGRVFRDAGGGMVRLEGKRSARTTDLMIVLLYSLAADLEELYQVRFDWRRYKGLSNDLAQALRALGAHRFPLGLRREHRVKWRPKKVLGLPDEQFAQLLRAACEKWGKTIPEGDAAFSKDPEAQRGALFYRNAAILLVQRFGGARRSEAPPIEFEDVDRQNSRLYLVTKGHGGPGGERLPVLLFPAVYDVIWRYVMVFRPVGDDSDPDAVRRVFLSHSIRNYGQAITDQTVRKIIEALRPSLKPPWDEKLTPHTLRHSYSYDLQEYVGEAGVTTNMRHASSRSNRPYAAGIETFAAELSASADSKLRRLLAQTGLLGDSEDGS
jgi:integrase